MKELPKLTRQECAEGCGVQAVEQWTEEKTRELQQKTELLASIFNTVPCGILRIQKTKAGYKLISANPAALTCLGYDSEEEMVRSWQDGIADSVYLGDRDLLRSAYLDLKEKGDTTDIQYRVIHRDGTLHWLKGKNNLVDIGEDYAVIQRIVLDITENERLKEEIWREKQEQKTKKALEEAYEAVKQASIVKSDFLSRMSHDIRTPMNAIMGLGELAKKNIYNPDKLKDYLEKMQSSGKYLMELIGEILDMSKIENDGIELNAEPFSLSELCQETADMLEQMIQKKQLHFELHIGNMIHDHVVGDSVRVGQIFSNLFVNAVKYTHNGGHIHAELCELFHPRRGLGCYQFIVKDDGIGMSKSFQEKMFQPFERAEDTRVSKIQGTGLGLSITQNLVRMMNGTIEVQSEENKGTCFTVTIYLRYAKNYMEEKQGISKGHIVYSDKKEQEAADSEALRKRQQWKILAVEDNEINRELIRELLQMEGIEVTEASNGWEAVEKFATFEIHYFDAILMDIQMPIMNGYQAARAIRRMKRDDAAHIPIIALSANTFTDDVYQSTKAGMDRHLPKPVDIDILLEVLDELIYKNK